MNSQKGSGRVEWPINKQDHYCTYSQRPHIYLCQKRANAFNGVCRRKTCECSPDTFQPLRNDVHSSCCTRAIITSIIQRASIRPTCTLRRHTAKCGQRGGTHRNWRPIAYLTDEAIIVNDIRLNTVNCLRDDVARA